MVIVSFFAVYYLAKSAKIPYTLFSAFLRDQSTILIEAWYWIKNPFYHDGNIICDLIHDIYYLFSA